MLRIDPDQKKSERTINNMSTRYYLRAIPKSHLDEIKHCKNNEDFVKWARSHNVDIELNDENEDPVVDMFGFGDKIYCFGSNAPFVSKIQSRSPSIFSVKNLIDKYDMFQPVICSQSDFLGIINDCKQLIIDYYNELMDDENDGAAKRKAHIDLLRKEWSDTRSAPINTDITKFCIADSWMYEYAIFEIVFLYKTFDWENDIPLIIKY